jgi:predicted TIM-barrel fold metal-dependent hydrolase
MLEIVDTHQHLWDLSRHSYSWCAGIPALNRSFVMNDYRVAADGLNIVATVHVEADVDERDMTAETRWLLELARSPSNPLQALVIKALPERDDFETYLDQFAGETAIKGVRRVFHTEREDLAIDPKVQRNIASLARRGLSFDICALPRQLGYARRLVEACPDVTFIVDHCGIPDIKNTQLDPWRADLAALAKLSNVAACKISGLVAYADASQNFVEQLRPFVDHTIQSFGPQRVMFGSDWPVCLLACPLNKWVETLKTLTADLSDVDRRLLFADNARRVYRLDKN